MVAASNRERRVAALEMIKHDNELGPITIPMISADLDETSEQAVERYVAEHGPLPDVPDGKINVIVLVPVAPVLTQVVA